MGDLQKVNPKPQLTQYLVENRLIKLHVVDVGSRGGFADCWNYYGDCLEIIGFDPDKAQAKCCSEKFIHCALSDDGEPRVFYIIRYPASSGFYPPNIKFTNRLQNRDFLNIIKTIETTTLTLDSLGLKPDFIKIDTEGSELEILQGGIETLKNVLGLSLEIAFQELFQEQPLFHEMDAFLKEQGFTIYDLETARLARYSPNQKGMSNGKMGQIVAGQALYFRDIYPEIDKYDKQTILKLASLFEVFKLTDCAFEILNNDRTREYAELIGDING